MKDQPNAAARVPKRPRPDSWRMAAATAYSVRETTKSVKASSVW